MIFDAALEQARRRQTGLAHRLDQLAEYRTRIVARLGRYTRFAARFEEGLAEFRRSGEAGYVPVYHINWWRTGGSVHEVPATPTKPR